MTMSPIVRLARPIFILLAFGLAAQSPGTVIVASKSSTLSSLTKAQLKKMLTGADTKLPNGGGKALVITTAPGSPERVSALKLFCGMTEQQFNADQIHASFVGEERARARTMPSGKAIVAAVENDASAIGIVSDADVTDAVKVLSVE